MATTITSATHKRSQSEETSEVSQATGPDPNPEIQTGPGSRLWGGLLQPQSHIKHTTLLYNVHRLHGDVGDRVVPETLPGEAGVYKWIDVYEVLTQISSSWSAE